MTNTLRHIESMQHTARALEELGRKIGYYGRDCDSLDAALKRGKSGIVLLLDEAGEVAEVFPIGEAAEVEIEKGNSPGEWTLSYEPMSGHNFEKTAARSHERSNETKGKFEPQSLAKAPGSPVKDEARRARMTADAKRDYQDSVMRNERIAAQMKAASDKLWNRSA